MFLPFFDQVKKKISIRIDKIYYQIEQCKLIALIFSSISAFLDNFVFAPAPGFRYRFSPIPTTTTTHSVLKMDQKPCTMIFLLKLIKSSSVFHLLTIPRNVDIWKNQYSHRNCRQNMSHQESLFVTSCIDESLPILLSLTTFSPFTLSHHVKQIKSVKNSRLAISDILH